MSEASAELERLDLDLRTAGVRLPGTDLTPIGALASHLARPLADRLQGAPPLAPRERARAAAFMAIERARQLAQPAIWPEIPRTTGRLALFVPRRPSHVRDLVRVQDAARARGAFDVAWLVFRADQAARLRPALYGPALAPLATVGPPRLLGGLTAALARWRRVLQPDRWRLVATELALQLPPTLAAASALQQALDRLRPDVVVVGNAYTTEGVLAGAMARDRHIPLATIQHGEIGGGPHALAGSRFDLVTVWGEEPRRRLIELGVPPERIAVTGAPWADALAAPSAPRAASGELAVMVALSGAGNAVGLDEHLGHIRVVLDAAARAPQHRWTLRLHPKDDPALWKRALEARPAPNARLLVGAGLPPIEVALTEHDALVTAVSASALDAMLRRVPVISLGRAPGEPTAGFVAAGATHHVPPGEDLLAVVDALATRGPDMAIAARAQTFVASYFGPRDGHAAARVVEALLKLLTSEPNGGGRAFEHSPSRA